MVHALREAHRVLKPEGILVDLRPMHKHRRAGIGEGEQWKCVGAMREKFADDRAANRAVARVLREGLFREILYVEFELERVMDTLEDFRAWLDEFVRSGKFPSHAWLLTKIERALVSQRGQAKIVVRGPLAMRVMIRR